MIAVSLENSYRCIRVYTGHDTLTYLAVTININILILLGMIPAIQ